MISVVVPTKGSPDLEDCLRSLSRQTRKPKEIIVVFDSKSDNNIKLAGKYGARAVFDTNGTIGGAYDAGASSARGDIAAFTDDDCVVPENWLEKIEKEFEEDIDVVSGEDILPDNSSFFQKAAYQIDKARIMKTAVYGEKAKNRLRAANIAYRKKVFEKESFNPSLTGLQEPEFHHRLFKKGFRMKFDPALYVYHKRRNSLKDIFTQIYRNGKAKIELIKMHKDMISAYDVLTFLYTILFLISVIYLLKGDSWFITTTITTTAFYFLSKPLLYIVKTKEFVFYPHMILIVFVREIAYFLGIMAGLKSIFKRSGG
ncbi:MAG: glycosyltransferase [Candidatus Aenigmarchaeota archaeon]|nr:glycosyltransferase [Candidatus Aenigmarchaeota archaeon]